MLLYVFLKIQCDEVQSITFELIYFGCCPICINAQHFFFVSVAKIGQPKPRFSQVHEDDKNVT